MTITELYNQLLPYAGQSLAVPGTVFPATEGIAKFCVTILNGNPLEIDVDAGGVVLSGDQQQVTVTGKTNSYGFGTFGITMAITMAMEQYSAEIAIHFSDQSLQLPDISWISLSNPGLSFTTSNASVPTKGAIFGDIVVDGETMRLSMEVPIAQDYWAFDVTFLPVLTIAQIGQLINGVDIAAALQAPFSVIATAVGVKKVGFVCSISPTARINTQILIGTPNDWAGWEIAPGIKVASADLSMSINATNDIGYGIYSTLNVAGVDIELSALYPGPGKGWTFLGQTEQGEKILLTSLFTSLCSLWNVTLPTNFPVIYFMNLYFSFETQSSAFTFGGELDIASSESFQIAGNEFEIAFNARIAYAPSTPNGIYSGSLTGSLAVGSSMFGLQYDFSNTDSKLLGFWAETGDEVLNLADIAGTFGNADLVALLSQIPPNMDLALTSASFTYDFTLNELVLTATSKNYGALVFTACKLATGWVYTFLVAIDKIDLTQLPLVGEDVGKLGPFEIDALNLLVCSGKIDQENIGLLNALIAAAGAATYQTLPSLPDTAAGLQQGVNLSMTFQVAGFSAPVAVGTATPKQSSTQLLLQAPESSGAPSPSSALALGGTGTSGNVQTQNGYWVNIQKAFGPVYMDKIGFNYSAGVLSVAFNFTLNMGPLVITLDGLSVGSTLSKFEPVFGLSGLSVSFNSGSIAISGGFVKQEVNGVTEYNGQALIKVGTFALSAMGSYANVDGETSMFIFAMITAPPLGGPPAFFVTGVAAGFGYNRGLVIPTLDQVPTFPLVSGFVPGQSSPFSSNDPGAALQVLVEQNIVPVQIGQNWLAAGIQFTSFEMLQSFALLVVEFGTSLEIAMLGLTTASIPTGDPRPLLFAQLALSVRILPDDGLIAVEAKLTSNSYLLDTSCHLTGGFAFYVWFGENAHAGDFVVTLGGYHPNFNKPSYYPDVPRLGFNWVVTSELTIKGGMYFALTSTCLMAGGNLEATWQSGNLKAWFNMGADFLISWKPYHYEIDLYISFGVSYTFKIDLLFVTITETISVSLGADLSIWGPAFSGVAHIHLWIISFTIRFGASASQTPPPISWDEFEQSFLPPAQNASQQSARLARRQGMMAMAAEAPAATTVDYQVWTLSVPDGLEKTLAQGPDNPDDLDWIVKPNGTTVEVVTLVPAKKYQIVVQGTDSTGKLVPVDPSQIVITNPQDLAGINVNFGVQPADVSSDDFETSIAVTLTYEEGVISDKLVFYFTARIQTGPKALWLPGAPDISDSETLVRNVLLGFDITSSELPPEDTPWADVDLLGTKDYDYGTVLQWSDPAPVAGPDQPSDPFTQLETTILNAPMRTGILDVLIANGSVIDKDIQVTAMATEAKDFLLAPPVFAYEYGSKG